MSKADEMFEELGYKNVEQGENVIVYWEKKPEAGMINIGRKIMFYFFDKTIQGQNGMFGGPLDFTMKELQAINEKCKELGWIE